VRPARSFYLCLCTTWGNRGSLIIAVRQVVPVCVVSIILAMSFRHLILRGSMLWGAAVALSLLLPLVGTVLYTLVLFLPQLISESESNRTLGSNLSEFGVRSIAALPVVITRAFFVVAPMGFLSQYVMNRVGQGKGSSGPEKSFRIALVVVILFALPCMAWMQRLNGTRTMTRERIWSYGPPSAEFPGAKHCMLTFVDYPAHSVGIFSKGLGAYLESLPNNRVMVSFEVGYDMGHAGGFNAIQIGTLRHWDNLGGYYGAQGNESVPPWPEL
jgi:hypothetical protein